MIGAPDNLPQRVESLDEMLIIIRCDAHLQFEARHLAAKLRDAFVDDSLVVMIVAIHKLESLKNEFAADDEKHRREERAQHALGNVGTQMAAKPDAGQRTQQQAAE